MDRLIKLAILDTDDEYAQRLAMGISEQSEFEISTYSSCETLESALRSKRYDIVLFDFSLNGSLTKQDGVLFIPLIGDEVDDGPDNAIYKYRRASSLCKDILGQYALLGKAKLNGNRACSIVVYSPIGGSGKTTIASVIATKLSMRGSRILYQNMECFSSGYSYFQDKAGEKGVSDLLEYIDSDIDFSSKLKSLLNEKNDNLFYMNSFKTPSDLLDMRDSDIESFTNILSLSGLFDCIVYDLDSAMSALNQRLIEKADLVIIVGKSGDFAKSKMETFCSMSHIINQVAGKAMYVSNFDFGNSLPAKDFPQIGRIGLYQNMDDSRLIDVLSKAQETDFLCQIIR